mmetsp:Transcript_18562/g.40367  ORF Transcript_18562/g.40367 Transcript_18562/m.40367 type:complete len:409 (+) Transcript_18562:158-1384(+)
MQSICRPLTAPKNTQRLLQRTTLPISRTHLTKGRCGGNKTCYYSSPNSNLSPSSKPPPPPSSSSSVANNKNANDASRTSKLSSPSTSSSKISQWIDALTTAASHTASRATRTATHAATSVAATATVKAKTAATRAETKVRRSLENAKIDAKRSGERYAWEAHRSVAEMGSKVKRSAEERARETGRKARRSMEEVAKSTKRRVMDEIRQRVPEIPKLPFTNQSPSMTTSTTTSTTATSATSASSNSSKRIADALPTKETILKSASTLAAETLTKTSANVTTQVQETLHKTTRWLWWWGLAAVGVYGMSTTLTKEGVQLLKDAVSGKKESRWGTGGVGGTNAGSGVDNDSDGAPAGVSVEGAAVGAGSAKDAVSVDNDVRSSGGRWMSSWFGWRTNNNKIGKSGVEENDD